MTREEFESILEECFIEGYNSALEDIEEDILDEEAFDLEGDYEYYTENQEGHPRTLRGKGQHNLPKGALGALRNSQKAFKKADVLRKKWEDSIGCDSIDEFKSITKKSNNAERKAHIAYENYRKKRYDNPEADELIHRSTYGPSYKNPIKRIINNRFLTAGSDKIMGKKDFLNKKIK